MRVISFCNAPADPAPGPGAPRIGHPITVADSKCFPLARRQFATGAAAALLALQPPLAAAANKEKTLDRPLRIVAFGTSLTARGGWTGPLEVALRKCLERPVSVTKVALSGATSDWGVTSLGRVISLAPDIVLIELYVNDAALDRLFSVARSRANLAQIIDGLRQARPGVRILVMAMNPARGLRRLIRPFLDRYVEAHRDVANEKGVEFLDTHPAWLRVMETQRPRAIPDGLHPLPKFAVEIVVPALLRQIAGAACLTTLKNASTE